MQFYIFIIRSNINALHFLCGGLTLSPQILQCPLFCHWKATNLSVTAPDVSPVILPLAFQKQLLHSRHSQQINLCILPDSQLLPAPPSPAPSMLPFHSLATAFKSFLCQCCFALRHRLLDGVEQSSLVLPEISITLPSVPYKDNKGKTQPISTPGWSVTFQGSLCQIFVWQKPHSCSETSFTLWCNYRIFVELLGAIPYSLSACRVQQKPHCLNASWAAPCLPQ